MSDKLITVAALFVGAAIGSFITWKYVGKKYDQIIQEEIDSVKETFSKNRNAEYEEMGKEISKGIEDGLAEKDSDLTSKIKDYSGRLQKQKEKYTNNSNFNSGAPYVITPEEFGEFKDYEKFSLTYYADKVLADENDELIDDVEEIVGFDSLNHFGEYENDSVFVRNDAKKCDYEILLDLRKYSDVYKNIPY